MHPGSGYLAVLAFSLSLLPLPDQDHKKRKREKKQAKERKAPRKAWLLPPIQENNDKEILIKAIKHKRILASTLLLY